MIKFSAAQTENIFFEKYRDTIKRVSMAKDIEISYVYRYLATLALWGPARTFLQRVPKCQVVRGLAREKKTKREREKFVTSVQPARLGNII